MAEPDPLLERPASPSSDDASDVDLAVVAQVAGALGDGDGPLCAHELAKLHPADASDVLEQLSSDQLLSLIALAPEAFTPDMVSELNDDIREFVVPALPDAQIAAAAGALDTDDVALLVDDLPEERRDTVLDALSDRDRAAVEESLAADEETAGRLMQREFIAAPEFWTVGQAIDHMRATAEDDLPEVFFDLYLIDPAFRPVASVALAHMLVRNRETPLSEVARELQLKVRPEMDQEDVAYGFQKYRLAQAPVVDDAGRLTGMITIDDMVDVIQEENTEDIFALAGVNEAGTGDTVARTVKARAPWLFVNLLTAVLASGVIALFDDAIGQLVALAVLMPIVASMGGNAGTQTLAVAVRTLAQRDLTPANARRIIVRETIAGGFNGMIFALVMGLMALLWFGDVALAGVIALAMVINLICAGLSGIAVPLALKRFGQDPAVSSSVFVTTATDIIGFAAFLGLASVILL